MHSRCGCGVIANWVSSTICLELIGALRHHKLFPKGCKRGRENGASLSVFCFNTSGAKSIFDHLFLIKRNSIRLNETLMNSSNRERSNKTQWAPHLARLGLVLMFNINIAYTGLKRRINQHPVGKTKRLHGQNNSHATIRRGSNELKSPAKLIGNLLNCLIGLPHYEVSNVANKNNLQFIVLFFSSSFSGGTRIMKKKNFFTNRYKNFHCYTSFLLYQDTPYYKVLFV